MIVQYSDASCFSVIIDSATRNILNSVQFLDFIYCRIVLYKC